MPSFTNQSRLFTIIMLSSFTINLAFGVYRSIFQNFAVEEILIEPGLYGLLEGIREVPGLLAMFLLVGMAFLKDERLYALSGALIAGGIWLYAGAGSYGYLIAATLVQSVGFHMWFVVQDSMIIRETEVNDRARRLGQINSAAAAGTMAGMGLVLLSNQFFSFRQYFFIFGIIGMAGAGISLLLRPAPDAVKRSSFVFDWRYKSYYILTLLNGARRHIVLTFASFALVKLHGAPVSTMVTLMMVYSAMAIFTRPLIGRVIDKIGEQRALSVNYAVIALVFVGYALIRQPYVIYALFILDNVMTGFDIAISTHAGRIIPKEKLSASLATGTTINHIFGVSVPIIGGVLWEMFGAQIPFFMGVAIVLAAMAYSWNLDARTARAHAALQSAAD